MVGRGIDIGNMKLEIIRGRREADGESVRGVGNKSKRKVRACPSSEHATRSSISVTVMEGIKFSRDKGVEL